MSHRLQPLLTAKLAFGASQEQTNYDMYESTRVYTVGTHNILHHKTSISEANEIHRHPELFSHYYSSILDYLNLII